jgi:hypothetical protein
VGAVTACGGDDDGGDDEGGGSSQTPRECEPANTFTCVGANNCRGVQICNRDGTWGSCSCGASGAGQGGSGSGVGQAGGDGGGPGVPADGGGIAGAGGEAGAGAAGDGTAGDGSAGAAGDGEAGSDAPDEGDEDCDNNADDDDDGDVDCADDDCGERICARTAPSGWDGPAVFFAGEDLPDECPNAYDDELARGGLAATAEDADCDTCSCSPSSPDCASFLTFSFGEDDDCGGVTCPASVSASCIEVTPGCLEDVTTAYLEPQIPNGVTSCSPSGQSPSLPDAEWTEEVLACAADGLDRGGCSSNSVCAPALPDDATLCILREGDHDCPDSGPYTERAVIYTDIEDDRTCSDCECDHDCDYDWQVFAIGDTTCETPQLSLSSENACAPVSPISGDIRLGVEIGGTGDCEPSGGEPSGGVSEAGAITVCCDG